MICGGSGADTASYGDREVGVTADLDGQTGDDGSDEDGPAGARDSIGTDVENLEGGTGDDLLFAKKGNDTLLGGAGNDEMYGHNGSDQLTGGRGTDTAVFGNYFGATVSIGRGVGDDGGPDDGPPGHPDTVGRSVENLRGGRDTLIGNGADNTLEGGGSSETLLGRGGRDMILATDGLKDERLDCGQATARTFGRSAIAATLSQQAAPVASAKGLALRPLPTPALNLVMFAE